MQPAFMLAGCVQTPGLCWLSQSLLSQMSCTHIKNQAASLVHMQADAAKMAPAALSQVGLHLASKEYMSSMGMIRLSRSASRSRTYSHHQFSGISTPRLLYNHRAAPQREAAA